MNPTQLHTPAPDTHSAALASDPPATPGRIAAAVPKGPLFILINPGSGSQDTDAARAAIAAVLDAGGRAHSFVPIADPSRIAEVAADCVARARAADGVVVAAGGDGTINAIVRVVLGSGCTFGVVPMGTFNYFGRTHHIPEEVAEAARVLLSGEVRPIQVGRVNDRIFLVNASLGLYPQLLEDREVAKQQFGRSRIVAVGSALRTLMRGLRLMRLWLYRDGGLDNIVTPTLFVGNNRLQLERIGIDEADCLARGQLAAIALRPVSVLGMLGLALRGSLGRLGDADKVVVFPFRELTVDVAPSRWRGRRAPRIKVATDGEIERMHLPLRFSVAQESLPLICPVGPAAAAGEPRA